jgi:hypothetical protein
MFFWQENINYSLGTINDEVKAFAISAVGLFTLQLNVVAKRKWFKPPKAIKLEKHVELLDNGWHSTRLRSNRFTSKEQI